ncbi:MAG TPA: tyrosine/phenylalanine carboxypeptidase domain-containing protein [Longimicrobiales bacterium]|nr:tyrosine/phenylalanine carboxypeptidase domain-containing protein [Longimicrobiales bacterium]
MSTQRIGPGEGAALEGPDVRRAFDRNEVLVLEHAGIRVVLDGRRPFLLVLRSRDEADPLVQLVRGEASYLHAMPRSSTGEAAALIEEVTEAGSEAHGAFLVLELWAGTDRFRVLGPAGPAPATVQALASGLAELDAARRHAAVEVEETDERHPPDLPPLLSISRCHELGCLLIGLEVPALYRDTDTGEVYPVFLRRLAQGFSRVLRRAVFEFLRVQTGADIPSYRALGRRSLADDVWSADRSLAEIDASFDLLLLVTPVNPDQAWERFRDGGCGAPPEFHYRLLPVDPDLLKRRLYDIRLEDIADPAAWSILRDKREELDRQISLLGERNTPDFLHGSLRLFGTIQPALLDRAREILERIPPPEPRGDERVVGAQEFASRAQEEFDHYVGLYPSFRSEVQIRPDLVGLMVSSGRLLIGRRLALRPGRVDALLQHEIGTHVLTYVNGAAQPFLQLSRGFADYDELQEGLGVLAEYLVGGLDTGRMRLLAARVLAAHCRIEGADFIETFRHLRGDHGFGARTTFEIVSRVYQSGGFTRDIIYLRGLQGVVEYLRCGGELEPMYVGKIAARHLELMREFRERGVIRPTPLLPRFLDRPEARERLRALGDGLPLDAMVADATPGTGGP